ncbi:MAG TPA: hypothetical protein VF387_04005 [Gemmatimonadaceae bacterium]
MAGPTRNLRFQRGNFFKALGPGIDLGGNDDAPFDVNRAHVELRVSRLA